VGGRDKEIDEVLQKVELLEKKNEYPDTLSGGEKQRVSIARAFLSNAALLLLDEPFSSLDTPLKIRLMQTFARLWQEKRQTVVFVTHDIEEALSVGHRILLIKDGKVCLDKTLEGQIPRNYGMQTEERKIVLQAIIE
jgi:ABC-type nitrate/sulfonate/bicarbonate transport system ATPase subunit